MNDWALDRAFDSSSGEVRWAAPGPEQAPPAVLVHGTPFSSYAWRGITRGLAQGHRVYAWDLPGYGASAQHAGQDVSLRARAEVFGELPPDLHRAVVTGYVGSASTAGDCARRCWTGSSAPGARRPGGPPSTGRSPRTASGSPTRSSTATGNWNFPCRSAGARRTPGSPPPAAMNSPGWSRAPGCD